MLPMRWNQPPWRNIEVSGVYQCRSTRARRLGSEPSGTSVPAGTRPRNSPGISPSSQTDWPVWVGAHALHQRSTTATLSPMRDRDHGRATASGCRHGRGTWA